MVGSIERGRSSDAPFHHLQFEKIFPDDIYAAMLRHMPGPGDYRALPGRSKENLLDDGSATRMKIDLFPEYIRRLPPQKRELWDAVGLLPIPVLTRDVPRYNLTPHTDTHWRGITVRLYLPPDDTTSHIGTVFHDRLADGSLPKVLKMPFLPNSGYAFAVGDNTWHSADPVGPEVKVRDSILLTYFVDAGLLRFLRNRGKRAGSFVVHEVRNLAGIAQR